MRKLSGLYFVVDITRGKEVVDIVSKAVKGGVDILQVWYRDLDKSKIDTIQKIRDIAKEQNVPLLINNNIEVAKAVKADGVHMDRLDIKPSEIKKILGYDCLVGYTIGNNIDSVKWADSNGASYISFCSIFPSNSVDECEIVPLSTVKKARSLTNMPIFASGGITLQNVEDVMKAGADGVAVISSIQDSKDPQKAAREFKSILVKYINRL